MSTRIHQLIVKQLRGKITPPELDELDEFKARSPENKEAVENLTNPGKLFQKIKLSRELDVDAAWQRIAGPPPARTFTILRYAAAIAAIIILCLPFLFFLWKAQKQSGEITVKPEPKTESNQYYAATLKRSNGQQLKLGSQEVSYPVNLPGQGTGTDTLKTFQKAYYSIQLPDRSIAWINCASTLLFPNSFSGPERLVQLDGEAYFEITKDASRPFRVQVKGMELLVTGTRFNVKAYNRDGMVRTTVIEGSVNVKAGTKTDSLRSGDEARLMSNGKLEKRKLDSAEKKAAWTNNQFKWEREELKTIVEDICRWYGLTPVYKGSIPPVTYSASLNRSKPLNDILALLERTTPLKFKIKGSSMWIGIR